VGETDVTAGEHVIKVEFTGGCNFAALELARVGDIPADEPPPAAEGGEADEAPAAEAGDSAADAADASKDEESGFDPLPFIIIGAVLVVIVVIIIILVARKNEKK
jgi:hypothetical protein